MTIWDDRILEALLEEGPSSVGDLTENEYIRVSNATVSRRCQKLAEHGFVSPFGNGVYAITDVGESYLDGELDAEGNDESGEASESSAA